MITTNGRHPGVLLGILSLLCIPMFCQEDSGPAIRAVSLRVLQKQCEAAKDQGLGEDLRTLGGLARVDGFIVDRAGKDIILLGVAASEAAPALWTEDLVVALRNTWRERLEDVDVPDLGFLGCSIDHDAGTYQVLMQAASRIGMHEPMPGDVDRWNRLCERPMTVSISKVPPGSHFARAIFDADLSLKRLVIGADSPDSSFRSLVHFVKEQAELVEKTGGRRMMLPILNVWLVPGANSYAEAGNTTWLDACPVVMSTDECLVMEGTLVCSGRSHAPVRKFADHFSEQFPSLVKTRSEFAVLGSLYRLVALSRIFKYKGIERSINHLLHSFPVGSAEAPAPTPGIPKLVDIAKPRLSLGLKINKWKIPACGGIKMDVDVEQAEITSRPELEQLEARILGARPSADTLWWDN